MQFPEHIKEQDLQLLVALFTILVILLVYRVARRGLRAMANAGHFRPIMERRLVRILRWVTLLVLLTALVQELGAIKNAWAVLSTILATIAVAFFALWSVLANVICAVLIVAMRPFRVGDYLELLESGVTPHPSGRVLDMNLVYTTLEDTDERGAPFQINVPNSWFFQKLVRKRTAALPEKAPADDEAGPPSFFGSQDEKARG